METDDSDDDEDRGERGEATVSHGDAFGRKRVDCECESPVNCEKEWWNYLHTTPIKLYLLHMSSKNLYIYIYLFVLKNSRSPKTKSLGHDLC